MTVCICCDTEEKILQQNAFGYDKWLCQSLLVCNFAKCSQILKIVSPANSTVIHSKVITEQPTTPQHVATLPCDLSLLTMHASHFCQFSDIDVSQGSPATYLRCDGIVSNDLDFVAYLRRNLSVKIFENRSNVWRSYGQYDSGLFF